ncbi:hypothetical protein V1520DRAFT_271178 [Lipomyces starkeyi]|uniref:ubiquitinyl hydrolase 1 n=1 Tax=Lipomyces starkeyi NRRL Y-11557 TaxID=675824 RepID=A0A1E3Q5W7_LIPST|nr:hypothetical protein LIPSTDRAFT_71248 [Lipomyces starkeyi NRRL Y-11557]
MATLPQSPGKSAPLIVQQMMHYLPGSASIALPVPQLPSSDSGSSAVIIPFRSTYEFCNRESDSHKKIKTIHIPLSSHVHHFISDSFSSKSETLDSHNDEDPATAATEESAEAVGCDEIRLLCSICRYHWIIKIDKNHAGDCDSTPMNIHHLIQTEYSPQKSLKHGVNSDEVEEMVVSEDFAMACAICSTVVSINVHGPRLTEQITSTFKQEVIERRIETFEKARNEAMAAEGRPELPPLAIPTSQQSYHTLFRILSDPLNRESGAEPRAIRLDNVSVNTKIDPSILTYFCFRSDEESGVWRPPMVNEDTNESKNIKRLLEDAKMEIAIIARQDSNNTANPYQISTNNELPAIRNVLQCNGYPTTVRKLGYVDPTTPVSLRYASLGAVPDFSDALLLQTFDRQNACDPANSAYYLECLREISTARESEDLQIRVVEMQSLGALTRDDLRNAYAEFGIDDPDSLNDDSIIIGIYKTRLQDAPESASKLKSALQIIADARDNPEISAYLQADSLNEAQSYSTLEVPRDADDDMIITSYEINKDVPSKMDVMNSALVVLAKTRKSPRLLTYAETKGLTGPVPDINAAYSTLGVHSSMEDSHIVTVYDIRVSDNPDEIISMRNALRSIAQDRKSPMLKYFVDTGIVDLTIEPEASETEPVGLRNIGNTCYLNSLLQFYFTVKPLREMILSFDDSQKEDVAEAIRYGKRIGGRKVTEWEINRAQNFVHELGGLFNDLIMSTESAVAPKHQLAYLTLVSSKDALQDIERRENIDMTMADADAKELLAAVQDTSTKQEATEGTEGTDSKSSTPDVVEISSDEDGDGMLVQEDEGVLVREDEDVIMQDKENISPSKSHDDKIPSSSPTERRVLGEIVAVNSDNIAGSTSSTQRADLTVSPEMLSKPSQTEPDLETRTDQVTEERKEPLLMLPAPESTTSSKFPPTVPPRDDYMNLGMQQDVTECIDNVLFQIEAALKPQNTDVDGEQIDLVKDLFYGKTKQTLEIRAAARTSANGESSATGGSLLVRTKEERFSHIIVDVAAGPRDIYDALGACFDVETVKLDGHPARRYVTLTQLPPILQIQVQRVQYDREQGRVFKSNAPLKFDSTIYLDRYMDCLPSDQLKGADLKKRREEVWAWKEELQLLEKRKENLSAIVDKHNDLTALQTLKATREWLLQVRGATTGITAAVDMNASISSSDESLLERQEGLGESAEDVEGNATLTDIISDIQSEMKALDDSIPELDIKIQDLNAKITSQYADLKNLGYRVHSVFVHRGQATFGHYWIYIYDFAARKFRKYNDERVTDVSEAEVLPFAKDEFAQITMANFDNSAATPYFLVFVREDLTDQLLEAVKRKLPKKLVEDSLEPVLEPVELEKGEDGEPRSGPTSPPNL